MRSAASGEDSWAPIEAGLEAVVHAGAWPEMDRCVEDFTHTVRLLPLTPADLQSCASCFDCLISKIQCPSANPEDRGRLAIAHLGLGITFWRQRHQARAASRALRKAIRWARSESPDQESRWQAVEGAALAWLASVHLAMERHDEAEGYLRQAEDGIARAGRRNSNTSGWVAFLRGKRMFKSGRPVEAAGHLNRAVEIFAELENWQGKADALYLLARVHIRAGDLDQARSTLLDATLACSGEHVASSRRAKARWLLGLVCRQQGQHQKAREEFNTALALAGVGGESRLKAKIQHGIGDCHLECGDLVQAEQWFTIARRTSAAIHDAAGVNGNDYALIRVSFAKAQAAGKAGDKRLPALFDRCRELQRRPNLLPLTKAKVLLLQARVLLGMESPLAKHSFERAARQFAKLRMAHEQAETLAELAECLAQSNRHAEAVAAFSEALEACREEKLRESLLARIENCCHGVGPAGICNLLSTALSDVNRLTKERDDMAASFHQHMLAFSHYIAHLPAHAAHILGRILAEDPVDREKLCKSIDEALAMWVRLYIEVPAVPPLPVAIDLDALVRHLQNATPRDPQEGLPPSYQSGSNTGAQFLGDLDWLAVAASQLTSVLTSLKPGSSPDEPVRVELVAGKTRGRLQLEFSHSGTRVDPGIMRRLWLLKRDVQPAAAGLNDVDWLHLVLAHACLAVIGGVLDFRTSADGRNTFVVALPAAPHRSVAKPAQLAGP